jgi:hypothetical protein
MALAPGEAGPRGTLNITRRTIRAASDKMVKFRIA